MQTDLDSINPLPPDFGPTWPLYPQVNQFCRVSGGSIGSNVYPGFVNQLVPGMVMFRDREACYIWEPNGVVLQTGFYDCRLVGSYQGLPLYATNCCPSGGSSASSASSTVFDITTTSLPSATHNDPYNLQIGIQGGVPPISFSIESGTLPTGISLSPGGDLSGTPLTIGIYEFQVMAEDASGETTWEDYFLDVT